MKESTGDSYLEEASSLMEKLTSDSSLGASSTALFDNTLLGMSSSLVKKFTVD